ncbi:MAG: carotenoid 1,2-hydratase [Acidobacteriota bacterium]|nr:carotenoid 1,2-hydratase [Acidobacteriota bacterium]
MRTLALLLLFAHTYKEAVPGYRYQFPRDHFAHEDFRTEWWYYTGNVFDAQNHRYGFELVFFRQGDPHDTGNKSAWTVQNLYLAHAALTDVHGNRFLYDERLSRTSPGMAGISFENRRIWNGNWSVQWSGDAQTIEALTSDFRFHLTLTPQTGPIIQGENGVSQKGDGPGRASYYVSLPLLDAKGTIGSTPVTGRAWMDHEWFTEQLTPEQTGWDWFSVQLDDHRELMLFELRRRDGTIDPHSSGTVIDEKGAAHHLRHEDFSLEPGARWRKYPIEWRIRVPAWSIDLTAKAVMPNQELRSKTGGTTYWEGAVDYTGTSRGVGYLEMTGYEQPVKFGF